MLKYCNGCEKDLEIDNFYSYKKSICKLCVNKKVKCVYCNKEFNSTNVSKHIKQIHSTFKKTDTNDSTFKKTDTSDSTFKKTDTSDITSEITLSEQLYVRNYIDLMKNRNICYEQKDIDKMNKILARKKILNDKIIKNTINEKEKKIFASNLKKLKDINYFDEKLCNILLKSIH